MSRITCLLYAAVIIAKFMAGDAEIASSLRSSQRRLSRCEAEG